MANEDDPIEAAQNGVLDEPSSESVTSASRTTRSSPVRSLASQAAEFVSGLSGESLQPIRFEFTLVDAPDDIFDVRSLQLTEELGEAYTLELDLHCPDSEESFERLLGASAELLVDRGVPLRAVYGVIDRVEDHGFSNEERFVRVRVVPAFRLLEQEVDTRVFQGMTVPEIVSEVLQVSLGVYGRTFDAASGLKKTYHRRDYCVQFRESNLDFCCRLLEEEGITFFFEADEGAKKETLVLVDNNQSYDRPVLVMGDELPYHLTDGEEGDRESVWKLEWQRIRRPNRVVTRGRNEKSTGGLDEGSASSSDAHHPSAREIYLHDERRQIIEDVEGDDAAASFTGESLAQRIPLATLTLERFVRETKVLEGHSNVADLRPGVIITIAEHPLTDIDGKEFLVTTVRHKGTSELSEAGRAFDNEFHAVPISHEFRPHLRRVRPQILVSQTAEVVGPGSEEIYTDRFGRIRVRFHWDRVATDERSSCWMRVIQPWAGPSWGVVFIPRVGMEVIVQFLDGNPDRPVVAGSVYNINNMPPYTLPDEKTKSVIKTSSSPGGNGYNELTFEDAAGAEQIIVHAQKDFNETVENDHATVVHRHQTITVDEDQSTSVGGNQSNTVTKNQTETVKQDVTITVEGTRSHTITKKETVTLSDALELTVGKTEFHQVTEKLTEQFDAGRETTIKGGDRSIVETGDCTIGVSAGSYRAEASEKAEVMQKTHSLVLQDRVDVSTSTDFKVTNGKVTVESEGAKLKLTGADELSLVCGAASITLKSDGTIDIQGAKKASIGTPGSSLTAEPSGVTISGAKVSSTAMGIHEVKGALVKIN